MSEQTTTPLPIVTPSSITSLLNADAARSALTQTPVEEMTDEQLHEFVKFIRERRTSQQLSAENKPQRTSRKSADATPTQKAKLLGDLLAGDEEGDEV
jgi:hypothetical protein